MQVSTQWTGMKELVERLKTMPDAIQDQADEVILGVSEGMARAVKAQYRRGSTGKLQRGVRVQRISKMAYRVRSGAPHAHLVEFGTGVRRTRRGANRGRMPRFGPIFGVEKMRWSSKLLRDLQDVLRRAGRGAGSPGGGGLL